MRLGTLVPRTLRDQHFAGPLIDQERPGPLPFFEASGSKMKRCWNRVTKIVVYFKWLHPVSASFCVYLPHLEIVKSVNLRLLRK